MVENAVPVFEAPAREGDQERNDDDHDAKEEPEESLSSSSSDDEAVETCAVSSIAPSLPQSFFLIHRVKPENK